MKASDKIVEFKNVKVICQGEELNLGELTYEDFGLILNSLPEKEAKAFLKDIIAQIGEQAFTDLLDKLEYLDIITGLDEDDEDEEDTVKQETLAPVKFVNMDDFFSYDPELVIKGIDSVSQHVGEYLAFVNAGMTSDQAFELITMDSKHRMELELMNKQLELRKFEAEVQMKMNGVKQLLSR